MPKSVNNIDIRNMDLSPHMITIPAGTIFYRVVEHGQEPLVPTGKESRFVSEPSQYTNPEHFGQLYTQGSHISTGTAGTCVAYEQAIAYKESKAANKETYKLILNASISAVDMDSICAAEGILKPYIAHDHGGSWQEFYGKKVQAVHHESFEDNTQYNLVLFPDWIPDFGKQFNVERVASSG